MNSLSGNVAVQYNSFDGYCAGVKAPISQPSVRLLQGSNRSKFSLDQFFIKENQGHCSRRKA
jgi:hypothetical protein